MHLPHLEYFMTNYWNENGDLVYGNLDGAIRAFKEESREIRLGLGEDLRRGLEAGIINSSSNWDTADDFWNQFHRLLSTHEVEKMLKTLSSGGEEKPD